MPRVPLALYEREEIHLGLIEDGELGVSRPPGGP